MGELTQSGVDMPKIIDKEDYSFDFRSVGLDKIVVVDRAEGHLLFEAERWAQENGFVCNIRKGKAENYSVSFSLKGPDDDISIKILSALHHCKEPISAASIYNRSNIRKFDRADFFSALQHLVSEGFVIETQARDGRSGDPLMR